jgi:integrase
LGSADPMRTLARSGGAMKLTERRIETLVVEHSRKDRLIFDEAQRGLAVRVTASGSRTYLCQYTMHGQKWRVPLGSCSALSLSNAREAAAAIMGDVAKGKNPAAERKAEAAAERVKRTRDRLTLRVLIDDWNRLHLAARRPSYAAEAVRALHYAFAHALDDAAEDLDRAAVVRALDALTRRRARKNGSGADKTKGAAMTGRTAAYGRAAFAWAMKRGAVYANPFAALPIEKGVATRDRVLNDKEIAALWRAAGEATLPYGAITRLLILTGQRREEVAGVTWAELSDDLATWTIPSARTKNGASHIVALSKPAQDLLRSVLPQIAADAQRVHQDSLEKPSLVFPGERGTPFSGWSKAKAALDVSAGVSDWWLHDLRRTLATGLQRLGVRLEVTEAVLNHVSGSRAGIVGVYQRHDWAAEKRAALDAWSGHLMAAVEDRAPNGNVVALARIS